MLKHPYRDYAMYRTLMRNDDYSDSDDDDDDIGGLTQVQRMGGHSYIEEFCISCFILFCLPKLWTLQFPIYIFFGGWFLFAIFHRIYLSEKVGVAPDSYNTPKHSKIVTSKPFDDVEDENPRYLRSCFKIMRYNPKKILNHNKNNPYNKHIIDCANYYEKIHGSWVK